MPFKMLTSKEFDQETLPIKQRPTVIFSKIQFVEDTSSHLVVLAKDNFSSEPSLWMLLIDIRKGKILVNSEILVDKAEGPYLEGASLCQSSDVYMVQDQFSTSIFSSNESQPKSHCQNYQVALNFGDSLNRLKVIEFRVATLP
mmetsp:Transcript_5652/g.8941  ORF Transcript_5652/g.8941 Transcript_5652/m.8941 type:complete len:143 (+) Transcript_5652:3003-3431(+)